MTDTPDISPPRDAYRPEPPAPRRTSGQAIASLVFGVLSVIGGGFLLIPPLLAVVLGHFAVGACNRDPGLDGKGLAIAGLVLGWVALAGWLAFLFFGGLAFIGLSTLTP